MTRPALGELAKAVAKAWSSATARQWTSDNPAVGQCNVTAVVVQERVGGDIVKTATPHGDHFYNMIDGQRYDFTDSQFTAPIAYDDRPSNRTEAMQQVTDAEYQAMQEALARQLID